MFHNEDDVYVFNPDYVMRNDSRRVVLFSGSKSNGLSAPDWESFLHPVHARIFSFFTYNRPLHVSISMLGEYLKRDSSIIRKIVLPYIENSTSVYSLYRGDKVLIPKNVIVNRKHITERVDFTELNPDVFDCRHIDVSTKRLYTGPQMLTFMLNNTCVTRCIYCYADKTTKVKRRIPSARLLELIDEAKTLPVRLINLAGGEIFLHPDWFIVLEKLVVSHLSPEYISTKHPLTGDIIHDIQKTGFSNPLQISLDACSSGLLQKSLSVKSDYLTNVLQGIKALDRSGLKYRINSVLTTFNTQKEVIRELFRFISELKNITDWRITPAVHSLWIEHHPCREIKPVKTDIEALFSYIESEIRPYANIPILLNREAINRKFNYCTSGSKDFKGVACSALNSHLYILPDGKATICEQLYWLPQFITGDVSVNSISEVWNSPATRKLLNIERKDIPDSSPCKSCTLFEPCFNDRNRCWVDIVKAYGIENLYNPDPRCAYAPPIKHNLDLL